MVTSIYDANGRQQSEQTPLGYVTTSLYNAVGQRIALQDAFGYLHTMVYDALGRVKQAIDPLGHSSRAFYNAVGQLTASQDALGRLTTQQYDAVGQLQIEQDARGFVTSFVYDARGQRSAVEDARGNRTSSTYDGRGSVIETTDPLGHRATYGYDATGNQSTRLDARNILTTYSYDPLNRLVGAQYPSGRLVTYAYDAAGQQTLMGDSTGLTNITLPNGGNEEYSYAADGLRRSKSVNGQTPRFLWDAENLLQEQRDSQRIAHYTNQPDGYGPLLSQRRSDGGSAPEAQFNAVSFGSAAFNQSGNAPAAPTSSFYGFDLSANTRVLTDGSGNVSDQYINTAFGNPISNSGNTPNPYHFGGEVGYYQDSNELSYIRARHYSNSQARWISQDPIGFAGRD